MYTTTYTWKSFDPFTARLTVDVDILWDSVFVETKTIGLTLPVDTGGFVTTDLGLIEGIINQRIFRYYPEVVSNTRLPPNGVVNAGDILDATDLIEADSGVPILIVPVGGSTGFTASVIISLSVDATANVVDIERSTLPEPEDIVPGTYILDNGNVNGGTMTSIRSPGDTGLFVNNIDVSWDETTVPAGVIADFPYVLRDPLPEGAEFNDYGGFYYVTHAPITISGSYAVGVFLYS
jgi:hypothetical protein